MVRLGIRTESTASCIPVWADLGDVRMQVIDEIRRCIAFIGVPSTRGFQVLGTGFFVVIEDDGYYYSYLVTAAHVLWPDRGRRGGSPTPSALNAHVRTNRVNDKPREDPAPPSKWLFHPDRTIDVCALPLGFQKLELSDDGAEPRYIDIADFSEPRDAPSPHGVTLGDEIFIPSAFVGRVGENRNIPVIRIGNIAAMPEEPIEAASPRRAAYLIETRSLGGVSGAPVFVNLQQVRSTRAPVATAGMRKPPPDRFPRSDDARVSFPYVLLGMLLGAHSGQYADDFVSEADTDIVVPKDVDFNAGISVVLPTWDILDFLGSKELGDMRAKEAEERRDASGYRASSGRIRQDQVATPAEPEGDSPSHKEDFTRLLGVAAKSPKPA